MDSIKLMMEEHQNILRMLTLVRKACYGLLKGEEINYQDFYKMIDFIRNYADAHHHGKEENFLFNEMVKHLGPAGEKLINHGMLVEHDHGRLLIRDLEDALESLKAGKEESILDVIANAVGYSNHLTRHIEKEDAVVYTFAKRELSEDILEKVNQKTQEFETSPEGEESRIKHLEILVELEKKYL